MLTKNMSLKAKVISICALLTSIILIVGVVNLVGLRRMAKTFGRIADVTLPNVRHVDRMKEEFAHARIQVRTLAIPNLSPHEEELAIEGAKKAVEEFERAEKEYLAIPFLPGEEEVYQRIRAPWREFKGIAAEVFKLHSSDKLADRERMARIFHEDCPRIAGHAQEALNALSDFHVKNAVESSEQAHALEASVNSLSLAVAVLGIGLGLALSIGFAASLNRTLKALAESLSSGADELASAATEISATSEELSAAAAQQASSLQETAASVEEMSAMVSQNADGAAKSSSLSQSGLAAAGRGKEVVGRMVEAIGEIDRSNREISDVIKVIAQIGSKTKVIDDIVFKTQLLSFNASVEAARAGEHGKGFAVVAEEVGNLAQMSGTAAREISELLDQSLERVERMIGSSKSKVETGIEVSKACGEVLDELVRKVAEVNGMAEQIAASSREQSRGIVEINKAMTQLDQVTQQNASAAQQSASASEQLTQQADSLRESVRGLARLVTGEGGTAAGQDAFGEGAKRERKAVSRLGTRSVVAPNRKSGGFEEAA